MITKKKILLHILWGGIFGLVSGVIVTYDRYLIALMYNLPVYKATIFSYYLELHPTVALRLFRDFEKTTLNLINLVIPAIFIGFTLGVASKSARKGFYGILGGILGAISYYVLEQKTQFAILLFPGTYAIPIGLCIGIVYKSLKKAMLGMLGGAIGSVVTIFCLVAMSVLGLRWHPFMGGAAGLLPTELCDVILNALTVILIPTGIFIGIELGEKKP